MNDNPIHEKCLALLEQYWGYTAFRPLQLEIISSVISQKDTLALLPTGGGKSVCYQIPALYFEGCTLVVSPLIALMQDQVSGLQSKGISAIALHGALSYQQLQKEYENIIRGAYKLVYVSPERLQSKLFREYLPDMPVAMIAVDEAHCISQWGHDFRPTYLQVALLRKIFFKTPVLALTASATQEVTDDIVQQLKLYKPKVFAQSFKRNNIFYTVSYSEQKLKDIDVVTGEAGRPGIVYCRSRKNTEFIHQLLEEEGTETYFYHAGLDAAQRNRAQEAWMHSDKAVIVATTAFGMGIDKSNVKLVAHYDSPEHLEAWYQEIGRAGRDGTKSYACTLFDQNDITRLQLSSEVQFPPADFLRVVYQAVAEYYQVANGAQPGDYLPFDLKDFAKKFKLPVLQSFHAIRLLEKEGLWELSDSDFAPTSLQITASRTQIDALGQYHPELSYTLTHILRMYSAVFHFPVTISIKEIAYRARRSAEDIEQQLKQLHTMEYVKLVLPKQGTQLLYTHVKVNAGDLQINTQRIAVLRERHKKRCDAMIRFLLNKTECREIFFLKYFGETDALEPCGHCDICKRRQNNTKSNRKELRNAVLAFLEQQKEVHLNVILKEFDTPDEVLALLRRLMDEALLEWQQDGMLYYKI